MIRLSTPADAALVSSLLAPFSPIALSLWADWQLWLQNPQQAQKFYLINNTAVLQYGGLSQPYLAFAQIARNCCNF